MKSVWLISTSPCSLTFVAPAVVAVARDVDLDRTGFALPHAPADAGRLAELAERYNLTSSVARVTAALASLHD